MCLKNIQIRNIFDPNHAAFLRNRFQNPISITTRIRVSVSTPCHRGYMIALRQSARSTTAARGAGPSLMIGRPTRKAARRTAVAAARRPAVVVVVVVVVVVLVVGVVAAARWTTAVAATRRTAVAATRRTAVAATRRTAQRHRTKQRRCGCYKLDDAALWRNTCTGLQFGARNANAR